MTKLAVLVGRFQVPRPHEGHRLLINRLIEEFDDVMVLVGSVNKPPSIKNPFSYEYRRDELLNMFPSINVFPLNDYKYNNAQWQTDVVNTVEHFKRPDSEIYFCGHWKSGNDYLHWFPQWKQFNVDSHIDISGSEIRESYKYLLPQTVQDDMFYFQQEAQRFDRYPYPETLNFNCADALLECNGHILLVERKFAPGAGNLALPGGFKERKETFLQCALRELEEETNVRIPRKVLVGSIVNTRLFDDPNRGHGIPRNTLVVHMKVQPDNDGNLPRANGGSDATKTIWTPISDALNKYKMHDDHGDIVSVMLGVQANPAYINYDY